MLEIWRSCASYSSWNSLLIHHTHLTYHQAYSGVFNHRHRTGCTSATVPKATLRLSCATICAVYCVGWKFDSAHEAEFGRGCLGRRRHWEGLHRLRLHSRRIGRRHGLLRLHSLGLHNRWLQRLRLHRLRLWERGLYRLSNRRRSYGLWRLEAIVDRRRTVLN